MPGVPLGGKVGRLGDFMPFHLILSALLIALLPFAARAAEPCDNPHALGTSRVLEVDARETPLEMDGRLARAIDASAR